MRTRIKFCGCTSARDALIAAESGADAIGLIFAESPRRISLEAAAEIARELPAFVAPVGVFRNPTLDDVARAKDAVPDLVIQLHGDEPPALVSAIGGKVVKAINVPVHAVDEVALRSAIATYPHALLLFDACVNGTSGGTGVTFPWHAVAAIARTRSIAVSGGLTAENVGTCIRSVRPFAVDVRSGVETDGKKDERKMRDFVRAVRDADAS